MPNRKRTDSNAETTRTACTRRRFWLKFAASLLFALVAYGAAYFALVKPLEVAGYTTTVNDATGARYFYTELPTVKVLPGYTRSTMATRWLHRVFLPAHWLDRRLRVHVWKTSGTDMPQNGKTEELHLE